MEQKFSERKDFYDGKNNERTKARLIELEELGMIECGSAQFGYPDVCSGLYLEYVWADNDENWRGRVEWAKELITKRHKGKERTVKKEVNLEDSMELALLINGMREFLVAIDIDYLRLAVKEIANKAIMYDSTAALNRSYNVTKSNLLSVQSRALKKLLEYIEELKKFDELKEKVVREEKLQDNIEQLFL